MISFEWIANLLTFSESDPYAENRLSKNTA
jgi:hypothetical protein